jgi:hypothetical protein
MHEILHTIVVPYSRAHLLEQFFDFEHVPFVHPRSIGRVCLRAVGRGWVEAEIHGRGPLGTTLRSSFRQEFLPPDRVVAEVVGGWGRGIRYEARLISCDGGTRAEERVRIPGAAGLLARLFEPSVWRLMRRIWEEDLAVKMCKGGWPGLRALGISACDPDGAA